MPSLDKSGGEIYGLSCMCHPESGIRYVGLTTNGINVRFSDHKYRANNGLKYPVYDWMRKHGVENIVIATLEVVETGLNLSEMRWIENLRASGSKLLNLTEGGEGASGAVRSPDYRANQTRRLSVLKEQDVLEILFGDRGLTMGEIAEEYSVPYVTISNLFAGKSWRHIPREGVIRPPRPSRADTYRPTKPVTTLKRIIALKKEGMSQVEIAQTVNETQQYVSQFLTGKFAYSRKLLQLVD